MVKLLSRNNEPTIVIDADKKPVFFPLYAKRSLEVYLPKLVRRLGSKELPAFKLMLIPVLVIPCKDTVYTKPSRIPAALAAG